MIIPLVLTLVFFFFQAEDGIRDTSVTGVQTCALPIYLRRRAAGVPVSRHRHREARPSAARGRAASRNRSDRSEERRVGKECRSRGRAYHSKKNNKDERGSARGR